MKTFLAIIGGLVIVGLMIVAGLFVIGLNALKPLTAEATAFADAAIPAIGADWDKSEFRTRATPELLSVISNGGLDDLMNAGKRQLGSIVSYDGATCTITHAEMNTTDGQIVKADCTASATFEKSKASFDLGLLKRDDEWKLLRFYITLPAADTSVDVAFTPDAPPTDKSLRVSFSADAVALTRDVALSGAGAGVETPERKLKNLE